MLAPVTMVTELCLLHPRLRHGSEVTHNTHIMEDTGASQVIVICCLGLGLWPGFFLLLSIFYSTF